MNSNNANTSNKKFSEESSSDDENETKKVKNVKRNDNLINFDDHVVVKTNNAATNNIQMDLLTMDDLFSNTAAPKLNSIVNDINDIFNFTKN
jgi:hypothetical protein